MVRWDRIGCDEKCPNRMSRCGLYTSWKLNLRQRLYTDVGAKTTYAKRAHVFGARSPALGYTRGDPTSRGELCSKL
jgi:hypothetical protein